MNSVNVCVCVCMMYVYVDVCYLSYHAHRTAPSHHPRLSGTSQEILRILGISCETHGSNVPSLQNVLMYKVKPRGVTVLSKDELCFYSGCQDYRTSITAYRKTLKKDFHIVAVHTYCIVSEFAFRAYVE